MPLQAATPRVKELKIPYESGKVHLNFPMNGIAGVVNNFLPQLLCHEWGNSNVP